MYRSGGRCCRRWLNAPIEQSTTACLYSSIWHSSSVYRVHCSGQTPIISDSSKHRATPFCWDFLPSSTLKDRQKSEIRGAIKSPGLFYLGTHLMAVYYWIHGSWHTVVLLLCTRANTQCHTPPQLRNESLLISAEHEVCQERMQSRWRPKCRPAAVLGCMQPLPLTASVVADAFPQIKSTTTYCDHRLK